jgi:hypothetical protein
MPWSAIPLELPLSCDQIVFKRIRYEIRRGMNVASKGINLTRKERLSWSQNLISIPLD